MVRKDNPNPAQESLVVGGKEPGLEQARDFTDAAGGENTRISELEAKLHLIGCLGALAAASQREGLVVLGPEGKLLDRYGQAASAVVQGAARRGKEFMTIAKWEFARSVGHFALIEGGMPEKEARTRTRKLFDTFKRKYYGRRNYRRAILFRKQLVAEVQTLTDDPEVTVSEFNRQQKLRPHKNRRIQTSKGTTAEQKQELSELDTQEKMAAILGDPRAGFMPKTHREKTQVMTWLDYLDNPEFPLGIEKQLQEVQLHSQKPDKEKTLRRGARFGLRANESICWEVGDYLIDAAKHLKAVRSLRQEIQDCSPRVKVSDEIKSPLEHPGMRAWVRHRDLRELIEKRLVAGLDGTDPLTLSENRIKPREFGDTAPGRHKYVLNQYTREDINPKFKERILTTADQLTVRDLKADLPEIEEDLRLEYEFMLKRMTEMQRFGSRRMKAAAADTFAELESLQAAA